MEAEHVHTVHKSHLEEEETILSCYSRAATSPMKPSTTVIRRCRKVNANTQAVLLRLLMEGVYTLKQLSKESGLHYLTVAEYCRALHAHGVAHIAAWDFDSRGRASLRVFKLGPGKDAPTPRKSGKERSRDYRAKIKRANELAVLAGSAKFSVAANGRLRVIRMNNEEVVP